MIEVNKPEDTTPNTRCYKCKAEFYVHPMGNINSDFVKNCSLHNPNYCEHESDYAISQDTNPPVINKHCKKCGEFYR